MRMPETHVLKSMQHISNAVSPSHLGDASGIVCMGRAEMQGPGHCSQSSQRTPVIMSMTNPRVTCHRLIMVCVLLFSSLLFSPMDTPCVGGCCSFVTNDPVCNIPANIWRVLCCVWHRSNETSLTRSRELCVTPRWCTHQASTTRSSSPPSRPWRSRTLRPASCR